MKNLNTTSPEAVELLARFEEIRELATDAHARQLEASRRERCAREAYYGARAQGDRNAIRRTNNACSDAYADLKTSERLDRSALSAAYQTLGAYVARVLVDNADDLDGENLRYKRTLAKISDAMPNGTRCSWSEHETALYLVIDGRTCSDGSDYLSVTNWAKTGEIFDAGTIRERYKNGWYRPGSTPGEIVEALDAFRDNVIMLTEANRTYNATVKRFQQAVRPLVLGDGFDVDFSNLPRLDV